VFPLQTSGPGLFFRTFQRKTPEEKLKKKNQKIKRFNLSRRGEKKGKQEKVGCGERDKDDDG
jgi:hypothetical protein